MAELGVRSYYFSRSIHVANDEIVGSIHNLGLETVKCVAGVSGVWLAVAIREIVEQ